MLNRAVSVDDMLLGVLVVRDGGLHTWLVSHEIIDKKHYCLSFYIHPDCILSYLAIL